MPVPIFELSFRDVPHDPALETLVKRRTEKLLQVCPHLTSCRVAIERPSRFQRSGSGYRVRIDLHFPPGQEVVVKREESEGDMHQELEAIVNQAFEAARRALQKNARQQRGQREVKQHPRQAVGAVVTQLHEGYGFARTTDDDRQIYFHENAVVAEGGFEALRVGMGVALAVTMGEEGPQATSVRVVDHRGGHREEEGESALYEEA